MNCPKPLAWIICVCFVSIVSAAAFATAEADVATAAAVTATGLLLLLLLSCCCFVVVVVVVVTTATATDTNTSTITCVFQFPEAFMHILRFPGKRCRQGVPGPAERVVYQQNVSGMRHADPETLQSLSRGLPCDSGVPEQRPGGENVLPDAWIRGWRYSGSQLVRNILRKQINSVQKTE